VGLRPGSVSGVATDPVIVVGAGPVGLVTAYGLARAGIPVLVIEAEAEVIDSPRAMVYHWALHEDLDRLGLLTEMEQRGFRKDDYGYRVHATGEMVTYNLDSLAAETPYPYNIHLGQDALCEILLARLAEFAHVTVRWGEPVIGLRQDPGTVQVQTEAATYAGTWAIGADGARSTVRRVLGIDFAGMTWDTRFVATNVHFDFSAHGYTRSVFLMDDVHGAVIAKIGGDLWRVTYSEDLSLPEAGIADRLPDHFAAILPDGGTAGYEVERFAGYRLHQRAAERMRDGRVLLAGDAAHATNPTGGFGLTGGLFDAFALIDTLVAVIADGGGDGLVDDWAADRQRVFTEIASPAATRMKRTVYDADRAAAEQTCRELREMIADPAAFRERLAFPAKLRGLRRSPTPAS
jgi:2-polyprenyl-6-methoxyphenol hydroxylase-like FAD-dependent oxidoreductase